MALSNEEQAVLTDLSAAPPKTFDAEYARTLLALRQSQKAPEPKPWVEKAITIIALITSSIAGITAGIAVVTGYWDRSDKSAEQTFNNQVAITKIYFDKLAGGDPKVICPDAELFSKAALTMAQISDDDAPKMLLKPALIEAGGTQIGEKKLAMVIYKDVQDRKAKRICDAVLPVQASMQPGGLASVQPAAAADSATYATAPLLATKSRNPESVTVWVQIPTGSDNALVQANRFKRTLASSTAFHIPAVEQVQAVPNHDQIRVYREEDASAAAQLKRILGLPDAQIVSLQSAYPKLPAHVMEVWLARTGASADSVDASTP